MTHLVVLRNLDSEGRVAAYACLNPETGAIELDSSMQYMYPPLAVTPSMAKQLMPFLQSLKEGSWELSVAPMPCPGCGQEPWANDPDFCYPTDRTNTEWSANCMEHNFGCGLEVTGDTREIAIKAWNAKYHEAHRHRG